MNKRGQGALVGGLIGVFIFAIIASALLPVVSDNIFVAVGNLSESNLTSTDQTIMQLWPTFIIIGGLMAILAAVGLR